MTMRASLLISVVALFSIGCGTPPIEDIVVSSADLQELSITTLEAGLGFSGGTGTLAIVDPEGVEHRFPISFSGPQLGFVELSTYAADTDEASVDLSRTSRELRGSDLLGWYGGTSAGIGLGIGIATHALRNDDEVILRFVPWGITIMTLNAGPHWLNVGAGDEE